MKVIQIGGSWLHLLPVVKGLVSEEDKVREAFDSVEPEVVGISISKEELAGLRQYDGGEVEMSDIEECYAKFLSSFGDVRLPPPCYTRALRLADERDIPIIPLDMNEELFSATYCVTVGTMDLIKESVFVKRLRRMKFKADSPFDFVLDWDKRVNRTKGFSELQRQREQHMASVVKMLVSKYGKVLAIIEYERWDGVVDRLSKSARAMAGPQEIDEVKEGK